VEEQLEKLGVLAVQLEVGAATTAVHLGLEQMRSVVETAEELLGMLSLEVVQGFQKRYYKV